MTIGKIHSIDTFSTLDGPGIRTVIFMQGCHLRCKYCQNPDTWDPNAATAQTYSVEEIISVILRSMPYFRSSGGGVTFSGGEPLLQVPFIQETAAKCMENGIHVAIDTSLYVSSRRVLEVMPFTNLFLADIKHIDNDASRDLTGAHNRLNIENLQMINEHKVEIWIRYVILPGYTDAEEDLIKMAEFVARLDSVSRIDLLPYHALGSHKWGLLGLNYQLDHINPPDHGRILTIKNMLQNLTNKPVFAPE